MSLKLYQVQRLVCVEDTTPNQYWVYADHEGPNPLEIRHRVRKKDVMAAVALFKDHPKGIENIKLVNLQHKQGLAWKPTMALEHNTSNE